MALLVLTYACALAPSPTPTEQPTSQRTGGILRLAVFGDDFSFSRFATAEPDPAAIDPHLDTFATLETFELFRCCLGRTLLSTNGRSTEEGGVQLQPDVAAALPVISDDGLTWTFTLRSGLRYSPPLDDVEITAQDFVRSFHRILAPALAEESFGSTLFSDVVGAQAYVDGDAASVAGLETPNERTLAIRVTKPAGDLGARLALPMIVPIPPDPSNPTAPFGIATGHDDGFGRFGVSPGPYMIEGSELLDFSRPAAERTPVSGLIAGQRLALVRNPSWDRSLDDLRPAAPDRIELTVFADQAAAAAAVYDGEAHLLLNNGVPLMPRAISDAVTADPGLGSINIDLNDTTGSVLLNVAQPPLEDIEVRRAIAFAIDKAAVVDIVGPYILRSVHHLVPDALENNLLVDYRPYPSVGDRGDVEAAKEHMRLSSYDTDGDGVCDAAACQGVAAYTRDQGFMQQIAESVRDDLAAIGLQLDLRVVEPQAFTAALLDPTSHVAMFIPLGWVKDSLSPASFFLGQFYSPVALAGELGNGSLVGASPQQLAQWGYETTSVPNVDDQIEACLPLVGAASFECWAALDQHMMENVVASISFGTGVTPILTANSVEDYVWDQLTGAPAYDQIVVTP